MNKNEVINDFMIELRQNMKDIVDIEYDFPLDNLDQFTIIFRYMEHTYYRRVLVDEEMITERDYQDELIWGLARNIAIGVSRKLGNMVFLSDTVC